MVSYPFFFLDRKTSEVHIIGYPLTSAIGRIKPKISSLQILCHTIANHCQLYAWFGCLWRSLNFLQKCICDSEKRIQDSFKAWQLVRDELNYQWMENSNVINVYLNDQTLLFLFHSMPKSFWNFYFNCNNFLCEGKKKVRRRRRGHNKPIQCQLG